MELRIIVPARCRPDQPLRKRNLGVCLWQVAMARSQLDPRIAADVMVAEHEEAPTLAEFAAAYCAGYTRVPDGGPFAKGRCINAAVGGDGAELLCLLDADCWVPEDWLATGLDFIGAWRQEGVWRGAMLPYDYFRFLEAGPSAAVAGGAEPRLAMPHQRCNSVGGAVWVDRDLFQRIGGWDEAYAGWGPDDRDFVYRLTAAMGCPPLRVAMPLWHLYHEEPDKSLDAAGWERFRAVQQREA